MRIGLDISVLSSPTRVGIENYTYNLIKTMLELNRVDDFVLFGISTFDTYDFLKNIEYKKYPNVKLVIKKLPARLFRTAFKLWQWLEFPKIEQFVGDVDLYHSFNWYFPPQKKGKKVATVFDMTSILFPKLHHEKTVELDRIRLERIKKDADLVITISENSKKDFLDFSPNTKVEVIYPAVSENLKITPAKKLISDVLKKYNLAPKFILSVATLEPRKNIEGLIRAYLESGLNTKLVLVGGWGWKSDQIRQMINSISERILVTGAVSDQELAVLYSQALCLVYPSFYEGFGMPILEAMASKIPVICSNTSSMPEAGGDAVIYVDPQHPESIKEALKIISQDKKLRTELIKKGLKRVGKFSWQSGAEKLNKIYHSL